MGRRRKLAELNRLDGNPGRRPIEPTGIEALGMVFVPEHLGDDARGVMEVVKAAMPPGVYAAADTFLLSSFAMCWAIHKKAALEIASSSFQAIVNNSAGSQTSSPWIKILNSQAGLMATLGDRLALSPQSRAMLRLRSTKQQTSKF